MAKHMKSIIWPEGHEAYAVKPEFKEVTGEENIREGIDAFRVFLHRFCDVLIAEGDSYDNRVKASHPFENRAPTFPFLSNVRRLLLNIGFHGVLTDDTSVLIVGSDIFIKQISVFKNIETLQFLTNCGIQVDGIDLNKKRQKLSEIETVRISYPDNPTMLIGLKVLALAEIEFGIHGHDILLLCDYSALKKDETDVILILEHIIKPLSIDMQNFILQLHQRYLDKGLTASLGIRGFWIKIKYSRGSREIWGINKSLNNDFQINVKPKNMHKYANTIEKLPLILQELIVEGYGCGRKRDHIGYCDGGCRGISIPLDESILDISDGIETWFEKELS